MAFNMQAQAERAELLSEDTYGIKMRKLRLDRGMRIQDAADATGVSRTTYNLYELGERRPCDKIKLRICKVFDVPIATLFY